MSSPAVVTGGYATCPKSGVAADVAAFYDGVLAISGLEIPVFKSGLMAASEADEACTFPKEGKCVQCMVWQRGCSGVWPS